MGRSALLDDVATPVIRHTGQIELTRTCVSTCFARFDVSIVVLFELGRQPPCLGMQMLHDTPPGSTKTQSDSRERLELTRFLPSSPEADVNAQHSQPSFAHRLPILARRLVSNGPIKHLRGKHLREASRPSQPTQGCPKKHVAVSLQGW